MQRRQDRINKCSKFMVEWISNFRQIFIKKYSVAQLCSEDKRLLGIRIKCGNFSKSATIIRTVFHRFII